MADNLEPLRGLAYDWPGVVAWFSGIVRMRDARASVTVPVPQFLGRLELMAVAWAADQAGSAQFPVRVRDLVVTRPDLPRFLAPGDKSTLAFELRNEAAAPGDYEVAIDVDGPVRVEGETTRRFHFDERSPQARMELALAGVSLEPGREYQGAQIEMRLRGVTNPLVNTTRHWTGAGAPGGSGCNQAGAGANRAA